MHQTSSSVITILGENNLSLIAAVALRMSVVKLSGQGSERTKSKKDTEKTQPNNQNNSFFLCFLDMLPPKMF